MELPRKDDDDKYFNKLLLQHIEQRNNAEVLAILKDINCLCQITDNSGDTLLHFAVKYGNTWLARYLIALGANINAQNHSKETPLMFAVQNQQTETVELLLEANADIFVLDSNGKCALWKAFNISRLINIKFRLNVHNNHTTLMRNFHYLRISEGIIKILQERVTIESLNNSNRADNKVFHIDYPLYMFASMKDAEITRVLLEKGSPVDAKEPVTGDTSLHIAVRAMDLQKIKLLLEYSADVNVKNHGGNTPLACLSFFRVRNSVLAILNALMAAGADLIDRDRRAILVEYPLSRGTKETVRNILKHPIDLHFIDKFGRSPLHYLAENNHPEVLAELRDLDFHVDIRNASLESMLHYAASEGNVSSVQFLLGRGADVNATCVSGHTPLCCIFIRTHDYGHPLDRYERCVEILLASGADPLMMTNKNDGGYRRPWLAQQPSSAFTWLVRPVLIHLSAIEASGQEIGHIMRSAIQRNPQFKMVVDSKKVEGEEMKQIKLGKSVTLLDVVVASQKDISLYARNRRIILASLNEVKKDSLDPCYQRKLHESSLELAKLIESRKKSAVVVDNIIGAFYNVPVYDIAEKIVDYLEDDELCKLLRTTS